ncbi:hypothetical protein FEM48_Zijuj01G0012800 [Ziziphus jujuba var. spinosa]|uniref:GDSL esterase/lipase At1g29670-like n=1 Tax=Ziziphus jujuba var. spinosa TaxID=714518 RepID=A0A978VYA9_ZIZJJ|nr:hypothetical protein FEM48_Zijuj01G0012800 [Ziziphus jujuba var. spinosa]
MNDYVWSVIDYLKMQPDLRLFDPRSCGCPGEHLGFRGVSQVPCLFIFGDSLLDTGNNNLLPTLSKVNYLPYGIDFPRGPTGRFSNGRNYADVVAELLGFEKYLPVPFASATSGTDILKGVNYASGSSGIRDESGYTEGARISLNLQLLNHKIIVARIVQILGNKELAAQHLSKCVYLVGIGSNDYANNYFLPQFYPTSRLFTPERYSIVLIQQLRLQLQTLYNLGARKLALSGLSLIGCTPYEVATYGTNGGPCVDNINIAVQLFNTRLRSLVDDLNANFSNFKSIYINNYEIQSSTNASSVVIGQVRCIPFGNTCANRNEYVFWDAFHPTEVASVAFASRAYKALLPTDAYPYDISQLALA